MKLTDRDIKSILKILSANELLQKYIDGEVRLLSSQLNKLIEIKNGEREKYD